MEGMHSAVRFGCSLADTFLDEIKEEVFEAEVSRGVRSWPHTFASIDTRGGTMCFFSSTALMLVRRGLVPAFVALYRGVSCSQVMAGVVTDEDEMDAILAATSPEDIPPPPTAHDTHLDQELRGSKAAAEAQAQAEAEAEAQAQAEQAKAKAAEEARVAAEEAAKAKAAEQEARLAAEAEAKAKAAEEARLAAEAEAKAKAAEEARLAAEAQAKAAQEAALRAAREAEAAKNAEAAARAAAQQQRQAEEENEGAAGL